ncbi:E3 ubiquitin/ISG15 ligase TRIM25 [Nibea albiflora]|uniref:E3 ubiquitin/ISG15 ligase TRIM25 n=1 Tax=Nibea albiflora TaxID=240163 RepID=A0ACB7FHY4_NIBAL|nr:E3 ubiquitin/ISG15 ligase TRIM25 [Nibea albiflora]
MAQKGAQLDQETISCSICLDLLKDPVTIPCGHSYCMNCIKAHWDGEDEKEIHSCPQCRQTFTMRPVLKKNTMLAVLVEELKKTGLQAAPADHCYAGPEDVACDVCTGRKLKALKSCLVCLASYCEKHLQPHFESSAFEKHKLVEPSKKLQENICSRHDEVMKMFCRTDQQCICYLCSVEEHKGHDTVSAAAERTERQRELEVSRQNIQQRIQDREKDVKELQQEVEAINGSADKAVEDSEVILTELISLMEKRRSDVKQQVRSQQETEVSRVKDLQEKLEQEITELKRKDAELEQLSHTEDHNQFLQNYPSLSRLSKSTDSSSINIRPLRLPSLQDVRGATTTTTESRRARRDPSETEFKGSPIKRRLRANHGCQSLDVSLLSPDSSYVCYSSVDGGDPCSCRRSPRLLTNGYYSVTEDSFSWDDDGNVSLTPCKTNVSYKENLVSDELILSSQSGRAVPCMSNRFKSCKFLTSDICCVQEPECDVIFTVARKRRCY